jgi:3-hydroxyacyl-[acyl-carrier-protein] dehydratase
MIEAELEHDGSGFAATKARILRDGKKLCDSKLMFRIMPFPNSTLKDNMLERYSQISQNSTG